MAPVGPGKPAADRDVPRRVRDIERRSVRLHATPRRAVLGRTISRDTERTRHPRAAARSGAIRHFRSTPASSACMSGTTDFTSTMSRAPWPSCHARMSIEPRSPYRLNVASGMTVHPLATSSRTTSSTSPACAASSSRSSASPCHKTRGRYRAPRASAMLASVLPVSVAGVAALGPRDGGLRHARLGRRLRLRPSAATADRPQALAKLHPVHRHILTRPAYRRLTARRPVPSARRVDRARRSRGVSAS